MTHASQRYSPASSHCLHPATADRAHATISPAYIRNRSLPSRLTDPSCADSTVGWRIRHPPRLCLSFGAFALARSRPVTSAPATSRPLPTRCSLPRVKGPSSGRWYIRPACEVVTITTLTPMSTPIGGFCVSLLSDDSRDEGQSPYAVRRKLSAVIVGQPLQSPCEQRNN